MLFRQAVASMYYSPRVIELAGEKNYEQELEFPKKTSLAHQVRSEQNFLAKSICPRLSDMHGFLCMCFFQELNFSKGKGQIEVKMAGRKS